MSQPVQTVSEGRAVEEPQPADGPMHVHVHVLTLSRTTELSQTLSYFKTSSMIQKVWRVVSLKSKRRTSKDPHGEDVVLE